MHLTNRDLFKQHLAIPSSPDGALEIVRASGIYIYDTEGKEYTDLVSGVSVSNIGHLHPKGVSAVNAQISKYMHLMVYGKYIQSPQVKLAKLITDNLPPALNSVYLVNSGSEAIEGAMKLAKRITGRTGFIAFNNAYHGSTHGALSILGNEKMKSAFRPLLPDVTHLEFNSDEVIDHITTNTAAVVMEPLQTEAGVILPKEGWLDKIRKRCDQTGTMLIFDEVQLGFGRTGKFMAFEHYNVIPDILCLAKSMGGGMPIGAFVSSSKNMNKLTFNPELGHITTFGGHPVSSAASLAGIKVLFDEGLIDRAEMAGRLFEEQLKNVAGIKTIRRLGLMIGVELTTGLSASQLISIFKDHGLIVDQFLFNTQSFRIAPPLIITDDQILKTTEAIKVCIEELIKQTKTNLI